MLSAGEWRAMRADDLAAVTAVSDAVHGRFTEERAIYAERLALYPQGCRVFGGTGRIAGYLLAHPWRREAPPALGQMLGAIPHHADTFYLHDIALLPEVRGGGAGQAALAFVAEQARTGGFSDITLMAVNGAHSYWARQGFEYSGRPVDPSYGADSYLMHRAT